MGRMCKVRDWKCTNRLPMICSGKVLRMLVFANMRKVNQQRPSKTMMKINRRYSDMMGDAEN
jgi:hypothetical protein